jgi:hypothetical protein
MHLPDLIHHGSAAEIFMHAPDRVCGHLDKLKGGYARLVQPVKVINDFICKQHSLFSSQLDDIY